METITIEPGKVQAFITLKTTLDRNNIIDTPHDLWMDLEDYKVIYGTYEGMTTERIAAMMTDIDILN